MLSKIPIPLPLHPRPSADGGVQCAWGGGGARGLFGVFLAQLLRVGEWSLGAWVPGCQRERARGEGERCVQDKSYLARPHPQHSDRPDSDPRSVSKPQTELLEAVFLARVIKIHIISHYVGEKLRLLGVVLALSPRENRRKAPSLIVTSFSRCNCPFNLPAVRSVCTWFAICRHWAATLSSPFPPKRSFLVMGHLPGHTVFQLTGARSGIL